MARSDFPITLRVVLRSIMPIARHPLWFFSLYVSTSLVLHVGLAWIVCWAAYPTVSSQWPVVVSRSASGPATNDKTSRLIVDDPFFLWVNITPHVVGIKDYHELSTAESRLIDRQPEHTVIVIAGVPFRSLWYAHHLSGESALQSGISVSRSARWESCDNRLPVMPLGWGFVGNTLFWLIVVISVHVGYRSIKAIYYYKMCRCSNCGYLLGQTSIMCPECGLIVMSAVGSSCSSSMLNHRMPN